MTGIRKICCRFWRKFKFPPKRQHNFWTPVIYLPNLQFYKSAIAIIVSFQKSFDQKNVADFLKEPPTKNNVSEYGYLNYAGIR